MGFRSIKEINDAYQAGQETTTFFRKNTSSPYDSPTWVDYSYSSGLPKAQFYTSTALVAATLNGFEGIYHGEDVAPKSKYLVKGCVVTTGYSGAYPNNTLTLCDYLLYYPLINMDTTETQYFENSITLPRYSDGKGVMGILTASSAFTGGASFFINYTNQDGVENRTSQWVVCNPMTNCSAGAVLTTSAGLAGSQGPWIPLQNGDSGIRSVQSITLDGQSGGIATLILVKPLLTFACGFGGAEPAFNEFIAFREFQNIPKIYDGAFLSFLLFNSYTYTAGRWLGGSLSFAWN